MREMPAFGMGLSPISVFSVFTIFILLKLEMGKGQLKVTSRLVQNLEDRWNFATERLFPQPFRQNALYWMNFFNQKGKF